MTIGSRIARARSELGKQFTQAWLAEALAKAGLKVGRSWVASVESGKISKVFENYKPVLAKILRKDISYFSDFAEPLPASTIKAAAPGHEATLKISLDETIVALIREIAKAHHSSEEGAALFLLELGAAGWRIQKGLISRAESLSTPAPVDPPLRVSKITREKREPADAVPGTIQNSKL